jgi:hypothetical protein
MLTPIYLRAKVAFINAALQFTRMVKSSKETATFEIGAIKSARWPIVDSAAFASGI